jgi:hypothetical protein
MKDAFDILFGKYPKDEFFRVGLEGIIYANTKIIDKNWQDILYRINNNQELFIRGYGRDAKKTNMFLTLYKHLFDNNKIKKDSTNNAEPTKIISDLTQLSKVSKKGFELIQNYQVSHLFGKTKNPLLFTAGWNIAYIPKYIDPFTGHETKGKYKEEFQKMFNQIIREKFDNYIIEYNDFIRKNVNPKIKEALNNTRNELKVTINNFNQFRTDVENELSIIK